MNDEPAAQAIVFIVDDDESLREALKRLFRSVGLQAQAYASASEFLASELPDVPSCLVLDIRLPGVSGLDFQAELGRASVHIPIIFITGHGDIPMTVKAMKAGAVEFLTKPFREQDLLDAVRIALDRDRVRREQQSTDADLRSRFERLTPREKEVMAFVASGLMNKQIAAEMKLAEITVKFHRGHIMRKMAARSLADLVWPKRLACGVRLKTRPRPKYSRPSFADIVNLHLVSSHRARCGIIGGKDQLVLQKVPMISIVDDDESFREATRRLIKSMGYRVSLFESAEAFLESDRADDSSCLIVDVHMPGLSGVQLQQRLIAKGNRTPIIFVSAVAHERTTAVALGAGAIGFLNKPFEENRLIACLDTALNRSNRVD